MNYSPWQRYSQLTRQAHDPHGSLENRAAAHGTPDQAGLAPHVPAQFCHALPGGGHGPARAAGTARPRRHQYDANLYAHR